MEQTEIYFSNRDLKKLIIPLFSEQLLTALVGIADVFTVGFVSESAVSGVSLVNSFNTIFIYLFTALSSGGAVIISQYIGANETKQSGKAASQLVTISISLSVAVSVLLVIFNEPVMSFMFGRVDNKVMNCCVTYMRISAYSYPALALYEAGAALYRSIGKTNVTLYISVISNIINVAGNIIGVFLLHAGILGVAYPSLIARIFSAVVITALCFSNKNNVKYELKAIFGFDRALFKRMLKIAVPNGIESGVFQLVKVALSSVVAMFGTYQIAANGVAQSIWNMASLVCVAMGPAFITVIGQCMGAKNTQDAEFYFKKLTKITIIFAIIWNLLIFAATPIIMHFYSLTDKTKDLVILLVLVHNIFSATFFPLADPLGKGLRAAGDVNFTTAISLFTTIGVRLVFSIIFGLKLNLGVMGIAYAMCLDWIVRGITFVIRYKSGKWKNFKVI